MNLKILGSVSPYSKGEKNLPGYLISTDENDILLDCGNGSLRLYDMKKLDKLSVIISHLHKDHYGDLMSLAYATYVYHNLNLLNKKIKVYLPYPKTKEEYIEYNYLINIKQNYINFICYDENTKLKIDNLNITFESARHDITAYFCKIINNDKVFVYSSDTGYTNDLVLFAKGVDLLLCESTYLKNQKKGSNYHLSAEEAGDIANRAKVKKLVLTHFWPEIKTKYYKKEAKSKFHNTKVAKEGKVFKI